MEGEPASAKDSALAVTRPHLVLDGAVVTARALRASEIHLVLPGDRPAVVSAIHRALAERRDKIPMHTHRADPRFVAGQAQAVLQLIAGKANLPVTAWQPEAVSGHRGRPTLLSNAETWAQVGRLALVGEGGYARQGTEAEPGTTLLTITSGDIPDVFEVPFGTRLLDVLPREMHGRPAVIGGFHGSWATWQTLSSAVVSVDGMKAAGSPLGAGVVISAPECPVRFTSRIVDYLAGESAGRCGPCFNGLPALAAALQGVAFGRGPLSRVEELSSVVVRRGACAHPDGTVRLVSSLLAGGKNSRLYKRLVYEMQIAQDVQAYQQSQALGSTYHIEAIARPGKSVEEIQKVIDEELRKLATTPPDQRELDRALNQIEASFLRQAERVGGFGGKANQLNSYYTQTGTPDFFAEDLARYRSLDVTDMDFCQDGAFAGIGGVGVGVWGLEGAEFACPGNGS